MLTFILKKNKLLIKKKRLFNQEDVFLFLTFIKRPKKPYIVNQKRNTH